MMTVCGPTQCCKTRYVIDIIKNSKTLIDPPPDKLIYLYSAEQKGYDEIKKAIRENDTSFKSFEVMDCNKGIPSMNTLIKTIFG